MNILLLCKYDDMCAALKECSNVDHRLYQLMYKYITVDNIDAFAADIDACIEIFKSATHSEPTLMLEINVMNYIHHNIAGHSVASSLTWYT